MHLRISRVMQCVQLLTTRGDSSGSLINYIDSDAYWCAYDVSAPAGLFRLAMVFAKRAYVRMRARNRFSHTSEVKVQSLRNLLSIETITH